MNRTPDSATSPYAAGAASRHGNRASYLFLVACGIAAALAAVPVSALLSSGAQRDHYSHIALIPLVSAYLLYGQRRMFPPRPEGSARAGVPVISLGLLMYGLGITVRSRLDLNDAASLMVSGAVLSVVGAFISAYGVPAARSAAFPLAFLGFMIPLPGAVMTGIIGLLQHGSAAVAQALFLMSGVPFVREGTVFTLPTVSIEVAPQCSGIRSTLALVITAALAGKFFLRGPWKRAALVLAVVPVTLIKNGIRITTLTLLGGYVDREILTRGSLHRNGGVLFFAIALVLLGSLLWMLKRSERAAPEGAPGRRRS